ncbi:hypothetical protein KY289_000116 [Solanum tuberosum]|nr:hypothetical protein KY289_000116 [Solanum tuberosum]
MFFNAFMASIILMESLSDIAALQILHRVVWTQLLSPRSLEGEGSKNSLLASPAKDHESSDHQPNDENVRSLELERREIIGEILKLNPSYKPPAGYKPLPMEAKIPAPNDGLPLQNKLDKLWINGRLMEKIVISCPPPVSNPCFHNKNEHPVTGIQIA